VVRSASQPSTANHPPFSRLLHRAAICSPNKPGRANVGHRSLRLAAGAQNGFAELWLRDMRETFVPPYNLARCEAKPSEIDRK
jgi:hypothetical protein